MKFRYQNNVLHAEQVNLEQLANELPTPFYCYSHAYLREQVNAYQQAFSQRSSLLCYSVKANASLAVLRTVASAGAGADVVSGGELYAALQAGITPNKIVFSGVGKTAEELRSAVQQQICQINVESEAELYTLARVAEQVGKTAAIGLRVNPDVDAHTHCKITTGKKENKFGLSWSDAKKLYVAASKMPSLRVCGIAVHIGSQLVHLDPLRLAFTKLAGMVEELMLLGIEIENIDLGGGLGITYNAEIPPTAQEYAQLVQETMGHLPQRIILEPGRSIVGNAGILVTRVTYIKQSGNKKFVIVDAGMNDLVRPAMYDAWHSILPVRRRGDVPEMVDVVGPICESSDVFAKERMLEAVQPGQLLAIMSAGAYGASMASQYNFRPLPAEVMVRGNQYAVTRPRMNYEQMLSGQIVPGWVEEK